MTSRELSRQSIPSAICVAWRLAPPRSRRDEFVQDRSPAVGLRSENTAKTLRELAFGSAPGEENGDVRVGHVHAFVEDVRGYDPGVRPVAEALEYLASLDAAVSLVIAGSK